jgi:hypothetical protein
MWAARVLSACLAFVPSVLVAHCQTLTFSTYLGVADCDGITLGSNDDIYLACHSPSSRLPIEVKPPKQPSTEGDFDAYVLRLNPRTGKLIYATRIGGSKYDEAAKIKVDRNGFAYAVGLTKSSDFPTTVNALQRQFSGGDSDGFLVKVAPDGQVVYATFLGGSGADDCDALELDNHGGVFVGGITESNDFPGQSRPRTTSKGDAFVAHIEPEHPETFHSVVFGGQEEEMITGLAPDGRGGLFAVGFTKSKDFPTIRPIQDELRGLSDLFLTRLDTRNLTLTFSTFFGGSGDDSGWGVTVDRHGNPIVAGTTDSKDLPTSGGAYQRANKGETDAFLAKFEGKGYRRVRATYWGGSKNEFSGHDGDDVKVDRYGNVWLVGQTASSDLPTRNATQPTYGGGNGDGFIVAFSPDLAKLCYGTYRGGTDDDFLEGLDISTSGLVYATGATYSRDLQMSSNSVQTALAPVRFEGKFINATVLGLHVIDPCPRACSTRKAQ